MFTFYIDLKNILQLIFAKMDLRYDDAKNRTKLRFKISSRNNLFHFFRTNKSAIEKILFVT